jgi:predicted dehydrogenase
MSTYPKLKVGMIGVGGFGSARRQFMRETGLYEIVAAYDHNPEALAAAEREDDARPMASYEALLDVPGLEAMVISTGAKFHAEQVIAAAARGLHIFVEKPLCATPEELQALLTAYRTAGVVMGMGHNDHSSQGASATIRRLIDAGELGTVVAVEATTCHSGSWVIKPGDWRGDPEKNPGGMLFQCGVHKVHELMYYCGPVTRVSCQMRYDVNPNTHTADAAVCTLTFANGAVGTLNAYHVTPYRHFVNIYGSTMNLYEESRGWEGSTLISQRVAPNYDGSVEPWVPIEIPKMDDRLGALKSFYTCVRDGGTPYPSLLDGARAVNVIFAAEESAKTGRVVEVDPLLEEVREGAGPSAP